MPISYVMHGTAEEVIIDKISVVLDIPAKYHSTIEKNLKGMLDNYGYAVKRPRYKFSASLYLDYPSKTMVDISINPYHPSFPYLRVELNPARAADYLADFKTIINKILPGGYDYLISDGRCTRIDAAVDIVGVNINDLLITYPQMQKTKGHYKSGKFETYTLGIKEGETEVCVYDKVAQIKYLNKKYHLQLPVPTVDTTRIEVRKKKDYPLKDLAALPNFFKELKIVGYPTSLQLTNEDKEKFMLFLEVCRSRGAQDALKMISEPSRTLYRNRMANCKLPWWNPDLIWSNWHLPANALLYP